MAIVKQGMSDWPGNDGEMTSDRNFQPTFSKRSLVLFRGFWFKFDVT